MKKTLKMLVLVIILVALPMSLISGCSSGDKNNAQQKTEGTAKEETTAGESTTEKKQRVVGVIMYDGATQNDQNFAKGVSSIVEARGDKVVVLDGVADIVNFNECITDLISRGVDGIVLEGMQRDGHISVMQEAVDKGILVVQSNVWCSNTDLTIGQAVSDNYNAAYEGGLIAIEKLKEMGEKGEVILFNYSGDSATEDRTDGFMKAIEEGGMELLANKEVFSTEEAYEEMENFLQAYGDEVNVVFCFRDPVAVGVISAIKAANINREILVFGVDGNEENLVLIKNGDQVGTAMQDMITMGEVSAQFLYDEWDGIESKYEDPDHVEIPIVYITKENVDEYLN